MVAVDESVSVDTVRSKLLTSETIPAERRELLAEFIALLHAIYVDLHFTYLEINPLVVVRPPPQTAGGRCDAPGPAQLTPLRFRVGRQQRSRA